MLHSNAFSVQFRNQSVLWKLYTIQIIIKCIQNPLIPMAVHCFHWKPLKWPSAGLTWTCAALWPWKSLYHYCPACWRSAPGCPLMQNSLFTDCQRIENINGLLLTGLILVWYQAALVTPWWGQHEPQSLRHQGSFGFPFFLPLTTWCSPFNKPASLWSHIAFSNIAEMPTMKSSFNIDSFHDGLNFYNIFKQLLLLSVPVEALWILNVCCGFSRP